jgi:hypothetical protein
MQYCLQRIKKPAFVTEIICPEAGFVLCALAMVLSDEGAKEQQPPAMLVRLKSLD